MRNRHLAVEALENRTLLAADIAAQTTAMLPGELVPGDANHDGTFDQMDVLQVLQAGKYLTGQQAVWSEGDWNGDGTFDQMDLVTALQTGRYGVDNFSDGLSTPFAEAKKAPGQKNLVPLKGTIEGVITSVSPTDRVYSGVGQVSHLGRVFEEGTGTVNVMPDGTITFDFNGSFTTVAGERLVYEGQGIITSPESYTSTWHFTEGTGRFEGLTLEGTSTAELVAPMDPTVTEYVRHDVGMISVPRW